MDEQDCIQLTLYPEASLASHSPLPGSVEARRMTVTSGRKCCGLCRKSGPLGSLARMLLESSIWNSTRCLLIWKVRVTAAKHLLFQLAASMPPISETDAQFWPTPTAQDAKNATLPVSQLTRDSLPGAVLRMWPTPSASDCGRTAIHPCLTKNGTIRHIGKTGNQSYARLDAVAALFPTPKANCGNHPSNAPNRQGSPDLQSVCGGSLNPTWVEWLMGFPIGWTDLEH